MYAVSLLSQARARLQPGPEALPVRTLAEAAESLPGVLQRELETVKTGYRLALSVLSGPANKSIKNSDRTQNRTQNNDTRQTLFLPHQIERLAGRTVGLLTLFLSLDSIRSLQEGLRSCLSVSLPATRVAEVVTVVEAVDPGRAGEAGAGEANCWSSVVLWAFSCCCFFFTSCSADFRSSRVTPWVDRRVSLTLLAWAFRWISCSSSRTGGTNDLPGQKEIRFRTG